MFENPYEPPLMPIGSAAPLVNREHRHGVAALMRRFLSGEITAFTFDESLDAYRDSPDNAVCFVIGAVWFHYDDCHDHLINLSKPEWDYFQRLLLLLESNHTVEQTNVRQWSWLQGAACISLLGYGLVVLWLGWGYQLFAVALPFGVISITISWLRQLAVVAGPYDPLLFPFASFSDLKSAYDAAILFKKVRYPHNLGSRRARSPLMEFIYTAQFYGLWCLFSPLALAIQMFPLMETKVRVSSA